MAKTVSLQIVRAVMTKHGGPPFSLQQLEADAQVFVPGELVRFVAGEMTQVVTDVTIYGVAHGTDVFPPNTRVQGSADSVWLGDPGTLFAANLTEGLNEGVAVNHVLVQADIGSIVGFAFDAANDRVYLVDAGNNSMTTLLAFVHDPAGGAEGELGDTNARVLFTFLPASLQDLAAVVLA